MVAPSRCWYSSAPTPEGFKSWVSLGAKEGHTKIQISESNWEPCGQKAEILSTALTMPAHSLSEVLSSYYCNQVHSCGLLKFFRCLLSKKFIRLGKWFFRPLDDSSTDFRFDHCINVIYMISFYILCIARILIIYVLYLMIYYWFIINFYYFVILMLSEYLYGPNSALAK